MQLIITSLTAQRRTADRVNLFINGEFSCGVAYEIIHAERLRVGDAMAPELLERIALADACWKAKQAALSLLATRARAQGELDDRLRRKGFSDAACQYAIAEATRLGLMDDAAFARAWVRDRLTLRPRGSRALIAELIRKRVAIDTAREAVAQVMADANIGDIDLCMAAAEKWLRRNAPRPVTSPADQIRTQRRLAGFLARLGYSGEAVQAAMRVAQDRYRTASAHV